MTAAPPAGAHPRQDVRTRPWAGRPAAVLLCLLGAGLALLSAGRPWAERQVVSISGLASAGLEQVTGRSAAPLVPALALVGLAGGAALLATRGTGRLVVGVLLTAAGAGLAVAAAIADACGATGCAATTAWRWPAVLGGVLLALAGLLVVVRGRSWPGLSRRYDAPAPGGRVAAATTARRPVRPVDPAERDRLEALDTWRALDRGEDPTA